MEKEVKNEFFSLSFRLFLFLKSGSSRINFDLLSENLLKLIRHSQCEKKVIIRLRTHKKVNQDQGGEKSSIKNYS